MSGTLKVAQGAFGVNKLHVFRNAGRTDQIVLYFPGDRVEAMGLDPRIQRLQDPATVAAIIAAKFPAGTAVVTVTASRQEGGYACYDHFLTKVTLSGEPLGYHGHSFKASQQLASLLRHADLFTDAAVSFQVVGFSKGGVVLNQLLAEVGALQDIITGNTAAALPPSASFLTSLRQFHFLDAGLNCRGAYTTDPAVLSSVGTWAAAHSQFVIILHGTPRQWSDPHRPWLSIEKNKMLELCRKYGVPCVEKVYFQGQKPSLAMHFDIIEAAEVNVG